MHHSRLIALAFQTAIPHHESMMQGIMAYARQARGGWRFAFSPETLPINLNSLAGWDGDGILTMLEIPEHLRAAHKLRCPVVNLTTTLPSTGLPTVGSDDALIGRLAADHLLERGFRRFACYGLQGVFYSQERYRGFMERIAAAGYSCEVLATSSSLHLGRPWIWDSTELIHWLRRLRCPVGLFAVHDRRARMVLEVCSSIRLQVPQDIAIVGVNNNPAICMLSAPHLTSVAQNGERRGYEAAALLDRLMSGRRPPKQPLLIPPSGIVARASTDIMAADDPTLRRVIAEIRGQPEQNFSIERIAHRIGVSRRSLERLFRAQLQCSPHEFIARVRVAKARELLAVKPPLRFKEIARQCGFRDARRLKLVFQSVTGQSPRAFRAQETLKE